MITNITNTHFLLYSCLIAWLEAVIYMQAWLFSCKYVAG